MKLMLFICALGIIASLTVIVIAVLAQRSKERRDEKIEK
jgi:hypothetical protein